MTDLELFQGEFKRWQERLGLSGWRVYFKYESLEHSFASIQIDLSDMVATVRVNSKLPKKDLPHKDILRSAKHEALHLLVARLEFNGRTRFLTGDEMYEASEELVHKLEDLIEG